MASTVLQQSGLSARARYGQVMDVLEHDLKTGKYAVGDRLPGLRELSTAIGVNHLTVRRGIQELVAKGLLEVRPRIGVFVADTTNKPRKTRRIVLGCRAYMFDISKHHPTISAFLMGAHRRFSSPETSVQTMIYNRNKLADELGDAILAQEVDGFVICTGGVGPEDWEFFAKHRIPLVHCAFLPAENDWPVSMTINQNVMLRQGVERLRQFGHRRIAMIGWEQSGDNGAIHREFDRMVFDYQLGDVRDLRLAIPNDPSNVRWDKIEEFFDIKPLPTAVITHDEFIADILLAGCRRRGIRVPEDLSILSLNDAMPFGHSIPLTAPDSVKLNSDIMYTACDILDKWIGGQPPESKLMSFVPEIVAKASTGPAR